MDIRSQILLLTIMLKGCFENLHHIFLAQITWQCVMFHKGLEVLCYGTYLRQLFFNYHIVFIYIKWTYFVVGSTLNI